MEAHIQRSYFLWHFGEDAFQHVEVAGVLAMKCGSGFVRFVLDPKLLDKKMSNTALGACLMRAERSQISLVINDVLKKQPTYKLRERESIKGALNAGVFGVLPKTAAHYLPHPEVATKDATRPAPAPRDDSDSEEDREIARDIKASQKHEAERMAAAKRSSKDNWQVCRPRSSEEEGIGPYAGSKGETSWFQYRS
ncbi:hypothetical protein R1sor_010292 [Riccia sorocarpa]|uniref:Uncharacterized protein n=1 Tax=Riccia sorocarpa TaxID=122646 RepID=A0ABD3HZ47_9MARC